MEHVLGISRRSYLWHHPNLPCRRIISESFVLGHPVYYTWQGWQPEKGPFAVYQMESNIPDYPNLFMSERDDTRREVGKTERLPTFINFIAVVVSPWERAGGGGN